MWYVQWKTANYSYGYSCGPPKQAAKVLHVSNWRATMHEHIAVTWKWPEKETQKGRGNNRVEWAYVCSTVVGGDLEHNPYANWGVPV